MFFGYSSSPKYLYRSLIVVAQVSSERVSKRIKSKYCRQKEKEK